MRKEKVEETVTRRRTVYVISDKTHRAIYVVAGILWLCGLLLKHVVSFRYGEYVSGFALLAFFTRLLLCDTVITERDWVSSD